MHQFSVITPTYNRAKYLPRIYNSLLQQDNIDFEWIIIDDGSSDNTKEVVENFNRAFEIKYFYQINAGKPTAVNAGVQISDSCISTILDSDDIFSANTLNTVWNYFDVKTGRFEHNCVCISGLDQYYNGEIVDNKYPHDYFISDEIRYIWNKFNNGDRCEFFITEVLKKYSYPIFADEKNIAPSIISIRIALIYKTIYVNKVFKIIEYLQDGLSTQNYYIKYPLGSELVFNERSIPPFRFILQIKYSALYIYFAKMNYKKHIFINAKNKYIFPLGLCAYYIYKFKKLLEKHSFFHFLIRKETKIFTTE